MIDKDIILAKVDNIQNCLKRIQDVTRLDPASLDNQDTQDIFVLNLQRATQTTIDLAAHVIASEGFGLPSSLREYFRLLEKAGLLSAPLARKMEAMVGFRNIAVHAYQRLDLRILKAILQDHLSDIEDFYKAVLDHYNIGKSQG
jgi:uncharacterized protein YutE (UPF0331/DUF86 family)